MTIKNNYPYLVVDLFAGAGGMSEGFSSIYTKSNTPAFSSVISVEKNIHSYETLILRHFFRSFNISKVPKDYYKYTEGKISKKDLIKKYPINWKIARNSAMNITLSNKNSHYINNLLTHKFRNVKKWVLLGGPPCQTYSLVGRSRRASDANFDKDERHELYVQYMKIVNECRPPIFIMENVKGILSANHKNKSVFDQIIKYVTNSKYGFFYRLYSLSEKGEFKSGISSSLFVIKSEEYGIPQARHRVFIVGIRSDIDITPEILIKKDMVTVRDVIGDMPRLRSGISKSLDSAEKWQKILFKQASKSFFYGLGSITPPMIYDLPTDRSSKRRTMPKKLGEWYCNSKNNVLTSHNTRSHMESDLARYFFAATYSNIYGVSPKLANFPQELLPNHDNVYEGCAGKKFSDRFRVQLPEKVATTITSHISKDGHSFIHYDPWQCRSLTVREAARLQTFPDDYFFEGGRTEQYKQVGNAVPPYLSKQIAYIIKDVLDKIP